MNADAKKVLEYAKSKGFTAKVTNGGHIRLYKPGCRPVFVSSTPSDHRMVKNNISLINRVLREVGSS